MGCVQECSGCAWEEVRVCSGSITDRIGFALPIASSYVCSGPSNSPSLMSGLAALMGTKPPFLIWGTPVMKVLRICYNPRLQHGPPVQCWGEDASPHHPYLYIIICAKRCGSTAPTDMKGVLERYSKFLSTARRHRKYRSAEYRRCFLSGTRNGGCGSEYRSIEYGGRS